MFALAFLLSSMICFNSKLQFEEKTLDELHMLTDLDKFIKMRAPQSSNATLTPGGTPGEDQQARSKHGRHKSKSKLQPRKSVGVGLTAEGNTSKQMLNQIAPKLLLIIRDSIM